MIPLEKKALERLHLVSMRIASPGKRFRNDITYRLEQDPSYKLTERQALYLWYLVDMYRRQIPEQDLKDYGAQRRLTGELPDIYLEGDLRPPVSKRERAIPQLVRTCAHTVCHEACTGRRVLTCSREQGHQGNHTVQCPRHANCVLEW